MSVMTKDTELRQMRSEVNHSLTLIDRVKNDIGESLLSVEDECQRRGKCSAMSRCSEYLKSFGPCTGFCATSTQKQQLEHHRLFFLSTSFHHFYRWKIFRNS